MIDYLRLYYPEDFNDFIESSEYIALIDLIAFLGQSLAFRTDLNARENFLDTAERRDSILKLARLVSYSPKRSIAASGLLKINSITTSETITDANGINLANIVVSWNDSTNSNWNEQFSLILNAALLNSQVIGKPANSQIINSIKTDEYTINLTSSQVPAFPFDSIVGGTNMAFEAVSASSINQPYIYEIEPRPSGKFNILHRNDNKGNGSNNTGYFLYFKQGKMQSVDFALGESVPNRVLNVGFNNINNSDVWLYDLTTNKFENTLWKSVPAVAGVNVIYNKSADRNLYQVNTREGDQIDLVFGDGAFSNVPQGNYRIYFRTSNGQTYKITPDEMQNATIVINYVSRAGNVEALTIRANLNYSVTNATANESINDIRQKAPQQYYSQGRMITGEDYNIVPYTSFSNILKVKAVNRTSSGISRYLDVTDSSGKYSSTSIFAEDGHLYKEDLLSAMTFSFLTTSSVQQLVQDDLTTILNSKEMSHFYYDKFTRYDSPNTIWNKSSSTTNGTTGYFWGWSLDPTTHLPVNKQILQLGYVTSNPTRYIRIGAVIRFKSSIPAITIGMSVSGAGIGASTTVSNVNGSIITLSNPNLGSVVGPMAFNDFGLGTEIITTASGSPGQTTITIISDLIDSKHCFDAQNQIVARAPQYAGDKLYIYSSVLQVIGDGTNGGAGAFTNGQGPVTLTQKIPDGAIVDQIIPVFKNSLPQELISTIATKILAYNNFALRYNIKDESWKIVLEADICDKNVVTPNIPRFSLVADPASLPTPIGEPGDTTGTKRDASWLIRFEYSNNVGYTIYSRGINYVFESLLETKFYFDNKVKIYDSKTGTTIQDLIKVLKVNTATESASPLGIDYIWYIYKNIVDVDGYENQNKVLVTFTDDNSDGIPDNPDLFTTIVNPDVNSVRKLVFFQQDIGYNSFISYTPIDSTLIEVDYLTKSAILPLLETFPANQVFFAMTDNKFYIHTVSATGVHNLAETANYIWRYGRESLYFQYRHNSPGYRRIDPSPNNIIDLFVLTNSYATDYQRWIRDATNTIIEPVAPTTEQLKLEYGQLENYKAISDTIIFNSAKFKPLFGAKATPSLQAIFKVVKNSSLNISDNDIKSSVINAINTYFDIGNWDFGESFFFSELGAYLHSSLSPNVSSVIIVPKDSTSLFGSLYQINAEADEILTSAATVENVEVISAITAAQINANYAGVNSTVTLGSTQ